MTEVAKAKVLEIEDKSTTPATDEPKGEVKEFAFPRVTSLLSRQQIAANKMSAAIDEITADAIADLRALRDQIDDLLGKFEERRASLNEEVDAHRSLADRTQNFKKIVGDSLSGLQTELESRK